MFKTRETHTLVLIIFRTVFLFQLYVFIKTCTLPRNFILFYFILGGHW